MGYIRIQSNDADKIDAILETARPLGVEVMTSETTEPEELELFYIARMNNKLDNLGQLRHLVKLERTLTELRQIEQAREQRTKEQLVTNHRFNSVYVARMMDAYNYDPKFTKTDLTYLTKEQIDAIFISGAVFA